jgi:integrase
MEYGMKRLLTDAKIRNAKPKKATKGKNQGNLIDTKYTDGGSMYLFVKLSGSKLWRYDCSFNNNRFTLSLGEYPQVSLSAARDKHEKARQDIANGIDPRIKDDAGLLNKPFSFYAKEAIDRQDLTERTATKKYQAMSKHLFKTLDRQHVSRITSIDILNLVEMVADNGNIETARRLASYTSQVFIYLMKMQLFNNNPARDIASLLPQIPEAKNFTHITDIDGFTTLIKGADFYHGDYAVKKALQLMPHIFLRPKNIRFLKWEYVDFKAKLIIYPADEMKMPRPHKVPLSNQAIEILKDMQAITNGKELVFSTARAQGKQLSENTLNNALARIKHPVTGRPLGKGFMTSHGFRHSASTFLNELSFGADAIELQLAHLDKDRIRRTYNKAELIPERTEMMQSWSDYMDGLKSGADIIPINRNA